MKLPEHFEKTVTEFEKKTDEIKFVTNMILGRQESYEYRGEIKLLEYISILRRLIVLKTEHFRVLYEVFNGLLDLYREIPEEEKKNE